MNSKLAKIGSVRLLAGLALLVVLALLAVTLPGQHATAAPSGAQAIAAPPPTATCTLAGTTRTCDLWALPGTLTLPGTMGDPAVTVNIWGFATNSAGPATLPGPILAANEGETLVINLHNSLPGETLSLSFSGMDNWQPDLVGVTTGGMTTYRLNLTQPGTYLYEAGMTPNGVKQIAMGLHGGLIVRPAGCAACAYAGLNFDTEALLVLSEIDTNLHADPANFRMENYKPNYWLINGKAYPQTEAVGGAPGSKVLLRYANAGSHHHPMALLGLRQMLWGKDGIAEKYPVNIVSEVLWPGQTQETMVTIPSAAPIGTNYALYEAGLLTHNRGQHVQNGGLSPLGGMITFVQVTSGNVTPNAGPLAKNVAVVPQRTTGAAGVTLSATIDDSTTGGQNVSAAEYFVDTVGATGAGAPFAVAAGNPVAVSINIPAATLATWTSTEHLLYVRGKDSLGVWGPASSVVLNLDYTGPDSVSLSLSPNHTNGTQNVALAGTADDSTHGNGTVISATYQIDAGPVLPMTLNKQAPVAGLSATIPAATVNVLPQGSHTVYVKGQDDLGNWGAAGTVTLTVDRTGPTTSATLNPATLNLSGQPPTAPVRLTATLKDELWSGVNSDVVNVEGFMGNVGVNGTGFAMFPSDGAFNSPNETAYYDVPAANFTNLPQGEYPVYVHGKDAAGNWGPAIYTTIYINRGNPDTQGPYCTNLKADPNPTYGKTSVVLTGTAQDQGNVSAIAAAEYYTVRDPGIGRATAMQAADGAFNGTPENIRATLNAYGWRGKVTIYVRAKDAAGNWGPPCSLILRIDR